VCDTRSFVEHCSHRNRVSAQIQALKKMPIRRFEGWCHAASGTVVVKLAFHDAGVLRKCGLFLTRFSGQFILGYQYRGRIAVTLTDFFAYLEAL
jgi:hypothetical protein